MIDLKTHLTQQRKRATVVLICAAVSLAAIALPFSGATSRVRAAIAQGGVQETRSVDPESGTALNYVAGSSVKVEQLLGDCDWAVEAAKGTCQATTSQTITKYDIAGTDIGYSFEQPEANR